MTETGLQSERLTLRPASLADVDALHVVFSDPRAMRYWDTLPHSDVAQTRQFVEAMIGTPLAEGEEFVAELDGRVIGKAGFWRFPEIGFILHPDCWGRGLGREAVATVVDHGFNETGLSEVTADVDPRNHASIRLLEKLGFAETGRRSRTIKVGEEWCDSVYYALKKR